LFGGLNTGFGGIPHLAPGYFAGTPCFTNPSYSGSFFCSQFLHRHRNPFGQSGFYPYYGYPLTDYEPVEKTPVTAAAPEQDNALASEVEALRDEVEILAEEQSSRQNSRPHSPQPQAAVQEKRVRTVFVYRDGHQFEAQDYAIQGKTLWIFSDQTTRKVPLADLDLDVTRKLNDARGVDFVSPATL